MGRLRQLQVLSTKSAILAVRNWKGSVGQLVAPLGIMLLMLMFQLIINNILSSREITYPPVYSIGTVDRCVSASKDFPCTTVLYFPNQTETYNLMEKVASKNNLIFDEDVALMNITWTGNIKTDYQAFQNYFLMKPNQTTLGVFFSGVYQDPTAAKAPLDGYVINFNKSAPNSYNLEFKRTLDEALMEYYDAPTPVIANWQTFPVATPRISSFDIVASSGCLWFYVPPMVTFFLLLTEIVNEKEQRLRLGMRMMGLNDGVYWMVWFITGLVFVTLSTLVLQFSGMACQFDFFNNSNFFAVFLVFFLFGVSMFIIAFFISTVVNKIQTAQTIGYIVILVGFVFQAILTSGYGILIRLMYSQSAGWIKFLRFLLLFYPPFNLAVAFFDIAQLSSEFFSFENGTMVQGPGFSFNDLMKENVETVTFGNTNLNLSVPAAYQSLLWMLADIVIFSILAWYFDNVLPGEHGSPRPLYFFVTKEYWGIARSKDSKKQLIDDHEASNSKTDSDVEREAEIVQSDDSSVAVLIRNLKKTYRSGFISYFKESGLVHALKGLNLAIRNGELFCLLGHNGAGKTTTINILTGLFGPSAGSASIYGLDVDTQIAEIRKVTGVCPQHDILWNELTAREHLRLFAKLKEIDSSLIEAAVQQKLEEMGLEKVGDNRAGTFSGGMKRRLSVAISAIGNPRIIFMDEPTTGMDPVNRRAVWQMIQDLKKDRVILLTTHSMEEADVLGDNIGIMAYGKLRCLGNSLHLKNKYGGGYRIDLVSQDPHQLKEYMAHNFPFAKLSSSDGGSLAYNIPRTHQSDGLIDILRFFEDKDRSHTLIQEWNVAHSSLEEVFLEVSKQHQFVYTDPEETVTEIEEDKPLNESFGSVKLNDNNFVDRKPQSHPYRALIRKNLALQRRQWGTNCCQIATPLYVLLIMLMLQLIIKAKLHGNIYETSVEAGPPYGLNSDYDYLRQFPPFLNISADNFEIELDEHSKTDWSEGVYNVLPPPYISAAEGCHVFCQISTFPLRFINAYFQSFDGIIINYPSDQNLIYGLFATDRSINDGSVGSNSASGTEGDGFFGKMNQKTVELSNGSMVHVPYFSSTANKSDLATTLLNDQDEMNETPIDNLNDPPAVFYIPDTSVLFQGLEMNSTLNYTLAVNDNEIIFYHRANFITRTNVNVSKAQNLSESDELIPDYGRVALMDWVNYAYLGWSLNESRPIATADNQSHSRYIQQMPYSSVSNLLDIVEAFGMTLYPIALTLQLPVYIYLLVLEKADKLREMMKCMGMSHSPYLLTNYLFFYILYWLAVILFWIGGIAIGQRFFTQTGFSTLFLFFFGWGHALIALAYLIAAFLNSKRAASVIGYSVALIGTLIAEIICNFMYALGTSQSLGSTLPIPFLIYPQFTFTRGIYLMNYACTLQACYGELGSFGGNELVGIFIALYLNAFFYFILALYLDEVLPREFGVPKEPLFFIRPLINMIKAGVSKGSDSEKEPLIPQNSSSNVLFSEDKDCQVERKKVEDGTYAPNCPLVLKNLRKEYPAKPKKIAVHNFCLAVEEGECFGLLGENGAGKTTTISMLTGIYLPTSGSAYIGGFDIVKETDRAHLVMGVCPQFNILWDDLTVEEHILFYARLKGIPVSDEKKHLEEALQQVGLFQVRERFSKNLSGGMKRRLSVAISLVGNSAVVFLDEPTTGLDPSSRRQLWKILQRAKKGRAIVLTTHAMDEAELLCNRIGILALGRLRCIGTSTHLRNNLSSGYRLQVNYEPDKEETACSYIEQLFPGAQLTSRFRGTSKFFLNPQGSGFSIADGFSQLINSSAQYGISDFAFSQFGLEDVFQRVVDQSREEEDTHNENIV